MRDCVNESTIGKQIQIALATIGARVFRNNVATAYVGNTVRWFTKREYVTLLVDPGDILIKNGRIINAGLGVGSSDYIGLYRGQFVACEVKIPGGRITKEQKNFISMVKLDGGKAFVATSPEEAIKLCSN